MIPLAVFSALGTATFIGDDRWRPVARSAVDDTEPIFRAEEHTCSGIDVLDPRGTTTATRFARNAEGVAARSWCGGQSRIGLTRTGEDIHRRSI